MNKAGKVLIIVFSCIGGTAALIAGTVILAKHKVFYKKIETAAEFKEAVNKGKGKLLLKNDIDFNGETLSPVSFEGTIDGEGHTISNFKISGSKDNVGLISSGAVKFVDLKVHSASVTATSKNSYVGILCGKGGTFTNCSLVGDVEAVLCDYVGGLSGSAATIENCTVETTIKGHDYVGGLSGSCVAITSSTSNSYVTGNSYVGGLTGYIDQNDKYAKDVSGCTSSGKVEASGEFCGGLIGKGSYEHVKGAIESYDKACVKIENCTNNAVVTSSDNYVGGIIGDNARKITNCTNSESAIITGHSYIGGIAGSSITLSGCTNKASVTSTISAQENDKDVANVGGVVGMSLYIFDCTNEGEVVSNGVGTGVGGVVGQIRGQQETKYINLINRGNVTSFGSKTGGVIGQFRGIPGSESHKTEINGCRNYGNVSGSGQYCGGILGYSDSADSSLYSDLYIELISACENEGKIECSESYAGGIAGYTFRTKLIKLCTNRGDISATNYIGGIAGETKDISECQNYGKIHGYNDQSYAGDAFDGNCGGIAGFCNNINQNRNHGVVHYAGKRVGGIVGSLVIPGGEKATQNSNEGAVTGSTYVGGIAGVIMSKVDTSSRVEFSNNTNSGAVIANNYAGGLIGTSNMTKDFFLDFRCTILTVVNCSNSGSVKAAMHYAAGIISVGYYIETDDTKWATNSNSGEIIAVEHTGDFYCSISKKGQD